MGSRESDRSKGIYDAHCQVKNRGLLAPEGLRVGLCEAVQVCCEDHVLSRSDGGLPEMERVNIERVSSEQTVRPVGSVVKSSPISKHTSPSDRCNL